MIRAGVNDIMLRQTQFPTIVNPCASMPAPKWTFTRPTPLLVQKGLSATVLQQELQIINNKSADR